MHAAVHACRRWTQPCGRIRSTHSATTPMRMQAPQICSAAKADTLQLSSILTLHACAASPTPGAPPPTSSAHVDAVIATLTQRVAALEVELAAARAELRDAQALRERSAGGRKGAAAAAGADGVLAAKLTVQRLEEVVLGAARMPAGGKGGAAAGDSARAADGTLVALMDLATHTAQMQDKLMKRLADDLEFARARLVSASKMNNARGLASARALFSRVRAASSETHDAAARLEALVSSLEGAISTSPGFSTLRPMAMQVRAAHLGGPRAATCPPARTARVCLGLTMCATRR
jgi:hypothetical protein